MSAVFWSQTFFLQGFYNFSGKEVDADFGKAYTKGVLKNRQKQKGNQEVNHMDGNSESIPLGPERSWNFISRSAVRRVRFSPRKD